MGKKTLPCLKFVLYAQISKAFFVQNNNLTPGGRCSRYKQQGQAQLSKKRARKRIIFSPGTLDKSSGM
jgi:hypothetical protein